ncbi:hypothetical protein [Thermococcus sp.]
MKDVKDSVEAVLDLNEKSVYSHIAHESAEDIVRIISSLDAERAKLRGQIIYYTDDWDDLIRERIAKGKRHTAFDFYNPALLDIWEMKVKEIKRIITAKKAMILSYIGLLAVTVVLSILTKKLIFLPVLASGPLLLFAWNYAQSRADLVYYELAQFFVDELAELIKKYSLNPSDYKFKLFTPGYFNVKKHGKDASTFVVSVEGRS